MREIKLTRGQVALVDDEDYERLAAFKWYARPGQAGAFYATRTPRDGRGRKRIVHMHREVLGVAVGDGLVDHINRNPLDNRRANLRICEPGENLCNKRLRSNSRSGLKGAVWYSPYQCYQVQVAFRGQRHFVGFFKDPVEAARAYDKAALEIQGPWACTNVMLGLLPPL